MTYVMSDIHGEYEKYREMLQQIAFSDEDVLYVLGDVIDRGPQPVELLRDMSLRHNVYPILGNHEAMALAVLPRLLVDITAENATTQMDVTTLYQLNEWQENGGATTLTGFHRLPSEERAELLAYLREFALYEVVEVGQRTYILTHGGLGNYRPGKKLREYTPEELLFARPPEGNLFDDPSLCLIHGHTPTLALTGRAEIYRQADHIDIDCGATFTGRLACLRLEDMTEWYV